MAEHARLQPSAAERWAACPGSVALAATCPDRPSRAAAEGTACHELLHDFLGGYDDLARVIGTSVTVDGYEVEVTEDMVDWVLEVGGWVRDYAADRPGAQLLSEERVCPGAAFGCPDDLWGTADVLVSSTEELLVLDAKFGYRDVRVIDNPQLALYALGAMAGFGWVHPRARLVVHQPRSGGPKEQVLTPGELEARRDELAPRVAAALAPGGPRVPTEDGCRWCPAAGVCPEAQAESLALARREFAPERLSEADTLAILDAADRVRAALDAVERRAAAVLSTGGRLPGWTLVYAEKRRTWRDPGAAEKAIRALGHEPHAPPKMITPAQADKKVGRAAARLLAPLWERPRGEPTLAREGDRRDPVAPDFTPEQTLAQTS